MFTTLLSTRVTAYAIACQERQTADDLWLEALEMNEEPESHNADDIEEKFEQALSHYITCQQAIGELSKNISFDELLGTKMPLGKLQVPLIDSLRVIGDAYFEFGQYSEAFRSYHDFLELYKRSLALLPPFLSESNLNNLYFNYAQTLQNVLSDDEFVARMDRQHLKNIIAECIERILPALIANRNFASTRYNSQISKRVLDLIDSNAELNQLPKLELSPMDERILLWSIASVLSTEQIKTLLTLTTTDFNQVEDIFSRLTPALTIEQQNDIQVFLADKNPPASNELNLIRQKMHTQLQKFMTDEEFHRQNLPANKTLHPWQLTANSNLSTILQNHTTAYFDVPTGAGKTLMFVFLAHLLDEVTLIIVPTKQLCTQTRDRIIEYFPNTKNTVSIINSDNRMIAPHCKFLITTYDSMVQEIQNPPQSRIMYTMKPKLVILDEVHRALATTRVEMTQVLRNSALVLGFSATVAYNLKREAGALDSAAALLHNNAFTYSRLEATRDQIISKWVTAVIKLNNAVFGTITKRKNLRKNKSADHDYTAQELEKIVNSESYNQTALAIYANGVHPQTGKRFIGESSVVFCNSVKHVKAVAAIFNSLAKHPYFIEHNVTPAVAIHGGLSKKQIAKAISEHAEGKIAVLCGVKILLEGWDCPRVTIGFNLTPTKSEIVLAQRGGRLIRWQPNKSAIIFEFDFG